MVKREKPKVIAAKQQIDREEINLFSKNNKDNYETIYDIDLD